MVISIYEVDDLIIIELGTGAIELSSDESRENDDGEDLNVDPSIDDNDLQKQS